MKFNCQNCGYNFEYKGKKIPKKCPYCDKECTLSKEKSAEELIENLE